MPIQRRVALLEYAERTGAWVIEDDYDSEFRFDGPPLNSLQSLAPERGGLYRHIQQDALPGTPLRVPGPPNALIARGRNEKWRRDLHNETTGQLALAEFIRQGRYQRHTAGMRRLYGLKRRALENALRQAFGDQVIYWAAPRTPSGRAFPWRSL